MTELEVRHKEVQSQRETEFKREGEGNSRGGRESKYDTEMEKQKEWKRGQERRGEWWIQKDSIRCHHTHDVGGMA